MENKPKYGWLASLVFTLKLQEAVAKLFLLILVILVPLALFGRGSVPNPGAVVFVIIMWVVLLYFLLEKRLAKYFKFSERKRVNLILKTCINMAIILCAIFITFISTENREIGVLSIVFFGICLAYQIKKYINE